ncbi:MAG TPA: CDP-alcohol phosphatidyltransferase family protein [Acidimicrobiales bacterium]|nr:CDP-alcohol phosphatidyltransferase family protein [Acidimicrobiales bacterium]
MFDGRWRRGVDRLTGPVGRSLVRLGITADVLTTSGLVFALATAVVVATGHLLIGIPLLAVTGFHDLFDGPVAKAAGTASVRGALFDSVMDRVADAVLMVGVGWYLVSVHDGELALLPLAVLGAASLVSYVRAKADALGLPVTNGGLFGGLMERAERMILLGAGFLEPWLLVPVLWALFGLTMLTAAARFVTAWRTAEGPVRPDHARGVAGAVAGPSRLPRRQERAARPGPAWRARRDGSLTPGQPRGELAARWRARRQEALESRTGRARARRERTEAARAARAARGRHGSSRSGHRGLWGSGPGDRGV